MLPLLLACHPDEPPVETSPVGEGLFLAGCPLSGQAAARTLDREEERPWGEEALAAPGDVVLLNEVAAFVIQGPDDPRTYYHYGGMPIDAVAVAGCDQAGPERFEEAGFVVGQLDLVDFNASTLHQVRMDTIEVVADGADGGPAIVEAHGTDDRFWLVELTLVRNTYESGGRKELGSLYGLDITLRYTLDPGSNVLQVDVLLDGEPVTDGFVTGAVVFPSDLTPVHAWSSGGVSLGGFSLEVGAPWLGLAGDEGSFALAMPGATITRTSISGVTALLDLNQATAPIEVAGAGTGETPFLLSVGATDAVSASAGLEPYLAEPVAGAIWGALQGSVVDAVGAPVPGASVDVEAEAAAGDWRLLDRLVTDGVGGFSGRTVAPGSSWRLTAHAAGYDDSAPVTSATGGSVALQLGEPGSLVVSAVDDAGAGLLVRVDLTRADGATALALPLPGESLAIAPGAWQAVVTHGYTHEPAYAALDIPGAALDVLLPEVVDTSGWVSMDTHVHAEVSADSSVLNPERVRSAVAGGVDLLVSTDHEAIVDYGGVIDELGLTDALSYGLGSEVTATVPEHVNAWPFPTRADDPRGEPVRWYEMGFPGIYEAIRARGAPVIQLNHSRKNGSCGILCTLDWDRMSPSPTLDDPESLGLPAGTEIWSWDFDSFELMNGLGGIYLWPDDPQHSGALYDWLAFHNLGHRVTAVGVTDIHGTGHVGQPRTWVESDDPSAEAVAEGVLAGRAQVSAGAFARVSIDGAGPGELASAPTGATELSVYVEALPGIDVVDVVVLVDCDLAAVVPATDPGGVVKLDESLPLVLERDAYVVVLARGAEPMPEGFEDYDPAALPRVVTNPIFVDVDGDGQWTAPGAKTCDTGLW